MRNKRVTGAAILLVAVVGALCLAQGGDVRVSARNPLKIRRPGQVVSVPWAEIVRKMGTDPKSVTVTEKSNKRAIAFQLFDSDLDGKTDELLVQGDFAPGESKEFVVSASEKPQEFASLVDARYVEPREDLAWENDRIAFRMYGPALAAEVNNGIDVWTKRVRYLIVKKWYAGEEQSPKIVYHIDHGEGADFFSVGRSLGCGGSGLWLDGKVVQPGVFNSYKIISTGPLRACFELTYDHWMVDGHPVKETKRISLDAGQNLNKIEVTFVGGPETTKLKIPLGLVKRPMTKMHIDKAKGWMSLWGPVNDSLPNGYLGTGIVFDRKKTALATGDSVQYLVVVNSVVGSPLTYYAGAGWTRSGDFRTGSDWDSYLRDGALSAANPIKVTVGAVKRIPK